MCQPCSNPFSSTIPTFCHSGSAEPPPSTSPTSSSHSPNQSHIFWSSPVGINIEKGVDEPVMDAVCVVLTTRVQSLSWPRRGASCMCWNHDEAANKDGWRTRVALARAPFIKVFCPVTTGRANDLDPGAEVWFLPLAGFKLHRFDTRGGLVYCAGNYMSYV